MAPTTRSNGTRTFPSKTASTKKASSAVGLKVTKEAVPKTKTTKRSSLASSITGYSPKLPVKDWGTETYELAIELNHGGRYLKPTAISVQRAKNASKIQQELRNVLPKIQGLPDWEVKHLTGTLQGLIEQLDDWAGQATYRPLRRINWDGVPERPVW